MQEHNLGVPPGLIKTILTYVMLILILGQFVSVGLAKVKKNSNSDGGDQGSYLQLGLEIKERRALTDGNRYPLYPALISLFAERKWAYFSKSKLLSLGLGVMTLLVIFALIREMYGDEVAFLTTLLLGVNEEFSYRCSQAECESLLVLLFFIAWYYTIKGFARWRCWMAAGFFAGLTYLTKGSGQLLLLCFLFSVVILYGRKILAKKKQILVFLAFYLAAASVLYIYNYKVYNAPLYNYNTSHVAWFDSWEEHYAVNRQSLPTMSSYLQTHTLRDFFGQAVEGNEKEASFGIAEKSA